MRIQAATKQEWMVIEAAGHACLAQYRREEEYPWLI